MFELLLSIFLSYRNAQLAKAKGQNTIVWVILTLTAFFVAYIFGGVILFLILYKGPMEQRAVTEFLVSRPVLMVTFMFFGLGGYLLIRYILERMPNAPQE